jgi:hypothetical protein
MPHSRGSLSSRLRTNLAPRRMRWLVMLSKATSTTSSGRSPSRLLGDHPLDIRLSVATAMVVDRPEEERR